MKRGATLARSIFSGNFPLRFGTHGGAAVLLPRSPGRRSFFYWTTVSRFAFASEMRLLVGAPWIAHRSTTPKFSDGPWLVPLFGGMQRNPFTRAYSRFRRLPALSSAAQASGSVSIGSPALFRFGCQKRRGSFCGARRTAFRGCKVPDKGQTQTCCISERGIGFIGSRCRRCPMPSTGTSRHSGVRGRRSGRAQKTVPG